MRTLVLIIVMTVSVMTAHGANRYWLGVTTSFNNTSNWSTSSGGASGASIPGSADIAIFDGAGLGNCTFDANVNVAGISVLVGYTGTISQGAFTFTIGTSNAIFSGGTFLGGSVNITCNGSLTISGSAFTSTNGTLTINNSVSFILSSGSFNNNGGTINFASGAKTITGNITFNNLTFTGGPLPCTINNTLTVNGTLTIAGALSVTLNNGTIEAKGDISIPSTSVFGGGTANLIINGTSNQTITGPGTTDGQGRLANVTINKASGNLNLVNTISVAGNWTYTTGTVNAGTSRVFFYTTGDIDATGTSTTMTFYNLRINGTSITRTLIGDINVSNNFDLAGSARVLLNGNTCNITANSTSGITTTAFNYFVSEATNNSGKIKWNIGSTTGSYIFPFGSSSGTKIPFTFQLTAGNAGNVTVSTYPTASDNTPYPTTPDNVTNVNNTSGDNSTNVIDRFWQIDKDGASGTANLTYTYLDAEVTGGVIGNENLLVAQRYNTTGNSWDVPLASQTANVATNTVFEPNVTLFSPRTLVISTNLLPIELISFYAKKSDNERIVELHWTTASETNNDYFTIERSKDGINWEYVVNIQGAGNSSSTLNYETGDLTPYSGISYYRLKQTDFNGTYEYSSIVSINLSEEFDNVSVYPNPASSFINIFGRDIYLVNIINMKGVVFLTNVSSGLISTNDLPNGIYILEIMGKDDKIIYKRLVINK